MKGKVRTRVFDESGQLKFDESSSNLINGALLAQIPNMVKDPSQYDSTSSGGLNDWPLTSDTKMTEQYLCFTLGGASDFTGDSPAIIVEGTSDELAVCKAEIFCRNESYIADTAADNSDYWHLRGFVRDVSQLVSWTKAHFYKLQSFTFAGDGTIATGLKYAEYDFTSPINCAENDTLVIDWTIQVTG
tara:strand:- start:312 stop:875 length:564 start_codon:yes stop_codon:yes gene_type:complete